VAAALALVLLAGAAAARGTARHVVGVSVFGASAVLMFTASALYHLARHSRRASLYRRLDHAMIYTFIAGTYTPVCLVALWPSGLGAPLLAVVWGLAVLGVVQKVRWPNAPRLLSTGLYLAIGWAGAFAAPALLRAAPAALLGWLLAGGLLYTFGAVVYAARWPRGRPGVFGFHELWHVFVIAASGAHYYAVARYLLPAG